MFNHVTVALVAVLTLGAAPAFAADQVVIPPSAASFDQGVGTLSALPSLTDRERTRLAEINAEYQARVDADKTKLGKLMVEYRDMQAHYAPVPSQTKKRDEIIALSDDIKAANKAAWAKAGRLLQGKVTLVNQGGGGGTIVVPGGQTITQPAPEEKPHHGHN
ncbi:MAG: hypothetical protein JWM80_3928 [Cyanobacteria bacterium RYN_339]|nr:hypothetical protein [Cyanobacteria bacterium RYN_339]